MSAMSENSSSSTVAASVDPRAARPQCGSGPADSLALEGDPRAAPATGDARGGRRSAENWSSELPDGVVLEGAVPDLIVLDRERHGGAKHGVARDDRRQAFPVVRASKMTRGLRTSICSI